MEFILTVVKVMLLPDVVYFQEQLLMEKLEILGVDVHHLHQAEPH